MYAEGCEVMYQPPYLAELGLGEPNGRFSIWPQDPYAQAIISCYMSLLVPTAP